jgi:acetyl-CoA carboxylase carboxyltransferase component
MDRPQQPLEPEDELETRHAAVLDAGRPEAVEKQRRRGQLTARERITRLLDPGSELTEIGALARPANPQLVAAADAVVVGLGEVHGRMSAVIAYDYTALGGTQGHNNHAKTTRLLRLAQRYGTPVFVLSEGGGARTSELTYFRDGPSAPGGDFELLARLSGRVPLVGVAMGRAFAGHAILLAECDTVIATAASAIGVAGPPLVKASTGQELSPEEIGAASIHEQAGAVERLAANDDDALALARDYARFFVEPVVPATSGAGTSAALRELASAPGPRDAHRLVELLADPGSSFELRPTWAREVMTSLARLEGRAVGVIASDPAVDDGRLTSDGCDKAARFAALCDAFDLPLLILVDSAGPARGAGAGSALVRHAARVSTALSTLTVPVMTVITGQVGGIAQVILGGFGRTLEGGPHLMWPTASVSGLGIAAGSPHGTPIGLAEGFLTDDVIDPGRTRDLAVRLLHGGHERPRLTRTPIDPW